MPLEYTNHAGRRFRLENQMPEEKYARNSCEGCVFDVSLNCTQGVTGVTEVDFGCSGENVHMVWKEMK